MVTLFQLHTEVLGDGLLYTFIGFFIVIAVLLLITFVLFVFAQVVKIAEKSANKKANEIVKEEPKVEQVVESEPVVAATSDDTELVAVITAAIAASLNTTSDKLVVRSIRKVNTWKKESIREKNTGVF